MDISTIIYRKKNVYKDLEVIYIDAGIRLWKFMTETITFIFNQKLTIAWSATYKNSVLVSCYEILNNIYISPALNWRLYAEIWII